MQYVPILNNEGKWSTVLADKHGGIHNQRRFKAGVAMLEFASQSFRRPQLCHIVFTGTDRKTYQLAIKRLIRALDAKGIRNRHKAAYESDELKGDHLHLMLVLEHLDDGPNLFNVIDIGSKSLLSQAIDPLKDISAIKFYICTARSTKSRFLAITKTKYDNLNDAVEWLSYIYKVRSKEGVGPTVYMSSREKAVSKLH
jgi:hypothetical protein